MGEATTNKVPDMAGKRRGERVYCTIGGSG
jgi:hypothetical protein